MSRQTQDYSQGKIYCIRNSINDDIYIGSTCQGLSQRMAQHRRDCAKRQHMKLYTAMSELGIENFYIELLEDCNFENFYQLPRREGELIREQNASLNHYVSGRTRKEYLEDNKDIQRERDYKNREKKKNYYEEHKDEIVGKSRKYYEANKDKMRQKNQKYYQEHKDEIKKQKKEYYEQRKKG